MTILFVDGYSHYSTEHLALNYTSVTDIGNKLSIQPTGGDRGNGCLKVDVGATSSFVKQSFQGNVWGGGYTVGVNSRFKLSSLPSGTDEVVILAIQNEFSVSLAFVIKSNGKGKVIKNNNGAITASADSEITFLPNLWYYAELLTSSSGNLSYRINQNEQSPLTGVGSIFQYSTSIISILIGKSLNVGSSTVQDVSVSYTDVYITNDTWLGAKHVSTLLPIADGSAGSQFAASDGAVNKYTVVDEATPDISDYVFAITGKQYFTYNFTKNPAAIKAVQMSSLACLSEAGQALPFAHVIYKTADLAGAAKALPINPLSSYINTVFGLTQPNASWTTSEINAHQFGFKVA